MTLTRAVQCDLTWTEDRAPVRTDPSAAPRAETEGRAVARHGAALPSLRDRHQCDKPLRQDAATALGTMPRFVPYEKPARFQFTVNQEMLAETNQNPAENSSPRKSPTSVASGTKVTVQSKFASLAMKDDEDECVGCGA